MQDWSHDDDDFCAFDDWWNWVLFDWLIDSSVHFLARSSVLLWLTDSLAEQHTASVLHWEMEL